MELLKGLPAAERVDRATMALLKGSPRPILSVILPTDDPSSMVYSRSKVKKGEDLGIEVRTVSTGPGRGKDWLAEALEEASGSDAVVIERPLPGGTDTISASWAVPPLKDVEGMHPENQGLLLLGRPRLIPPTALGVMMLLDHYGVEVSGKRVAVLGRGANVGRPLSVLLSQKTYWGNATVTLVHSRSPRIKEILSGSDVIIAAMGSASFVKREMVRDDAVLIDVGLSRDPKDGNLKGDIDLQDLQGSGVRATPTPGGTGPVTVSCMFLNVARAKGLSTGVPFKLNDGLLDRVYGRI